MEKFPRNRSVLGGYELDGFNPDLKFAFEYNGIHHYKFVKHFYKDYSDFKFRKEIDKYKVKLCSDKKIKLLVIPYKVTERNDSRLVSYIKEHLRKHDIPIKKEDVDFKLFYKEHRHIEELNLVANERGGECLSTEYVNNHSKVKWKCKKGHIWEATPSSIKSGSWCPECSNVKKLTIQDMKRIAEERGGKCLSDIYINSHTPLEWQCAKGHTWFAKSYQVKNTKTWCRICSGKNKYRLPWFQEYARLNNGVLLSETYHNKDTKLKFKCGKGHVFSKSLADINNKKRRYFCTKCIKDSDNIHVLPPKE
jgi:hypothetical protein